MIQYIKLLFRKKNELEKYIIIVETANKYYDKHNNKILNQLRDSVGSSTRKELFEGIKKDPIFFLGKGSRMEN